MVSASGANQLFFNGYIHFLCFRIASRDRYVIKNSELHIFQKKIDRLWRYCLYSFLLRITFSLRSSLTSLFDNALFSLFFSLKHG